VHAAPVLLSRGHRKVEPTSSAVNPNVAEDLPTVPDVPEVIVV
jgi:hypothetical protein